MITSGAATENTLCNGLNEELDTSLESNSDYEVQASTSNEALNDSEGVKQTTVDTNVNKIDLEVLAGTTNSFQPEITPEINSEVNRLESKQFSQDIADIETLELLETVEALETLSVDDSSQQRFSVSPQVAKQTVNPVSEPVLEPVEQMMSLKSLNYTIHSKEFLETDYSMSAVNLSPLSDAIGSNGAKEVGPKQVLGAHDVTTSFSVGTNSVSAKDSTHRLQALMDEFKGLLERYQQQTLKLTKSFSTITDAKATDIDLSAIGNVTIQQEDIDGYASGLAQLTQTFSTMESELEAVLRKSEYQELSRQDLEDAHLEMLERLADTSETRCTTSSYEDTQTAITDSEGSEDNATKSKHLDRVGELCAKIAQALGCDDAFVSKIASSARLHDIGKLAIPDTILQKPDRLNADEYATMKMHTIHGAKMLANNSSEIIQMAHSIALTHHENWDGTGYPYQLLREEIALEGRIAAVADVYDALISNRIYKEAWPKEKAVEQIKSRSGTKFDPTIVEAFLKVVA